MKLWILSAILLCGGVSLLSAQPKLSVNIEVPTMSVAPSGESWQPMPIPVRITIHNTGNVASAALSVRVSFVADLALHDSEQSITIKAPTPAVVPANDSAKVDWLFVHPPSFTAKNHRVRVWLKYSAVDSFETQKTLFLPTLQPPDFKFTFVSSTQLSVRPDSLGYVDNPFGVAMRLGNQGGTTLDSASLRIVLPVDYALDPNTQAATGPVPHPMPPPSVGNPRIDIAWTVRYYGATRVPRTDTVRFVARGKDITGQWREEDTLVVMHVDGLSPSFAIDVLSANSVQYDAATLYAPQPYRLNARIRNIGEQYAQIRTAHVLVQGEGVQLASPAQLNIGSSLLPQGHVDVWWDITMERRSFPRQFSVLIEGVDLDGRIRTRTHTVSIPGQPYALTVEQLQAPVALPLNTEGSNFVSNVVPLRYRIANRSWYNSTVQYVRVQTQGTGVVAPPFHEHTPDLALPPNDVSGEFAEQFEVEGALQDREVWFHILAYSDRGDTARASVPVLIPGLRPLLQLERRGPDALVWDRVRDYAPNPFSQEYILRNVGFVTVRVDSLRMDFDRDGVSTPDPGLQNIGWNLRPGDSLLVRWNFQAFKRDTSRLVNMRVTAWTSGEQELHANHVVAIPGLFPIPELTVSGDDTLSYDPTTTYTPNPFTTTLTVRNIGTDALLCDSVRVFWSDDKVTLLDPAVWAEGKTLAVDSALVLSWRWRADERPAPILLPIDLRLYHAGGKSSDARALVYIPALTPDVRVDILGDEQLTMNALTVYSPDPFVKTLRVTNTGTGTLTVDSLRLYCSDPDLRFDEPGLQAVDAVLAPGQSVERSWHGHSAPRYSEGYVLLDFTVYHSSDQWLRRSADMFIPGRAHSFDVVDVSAPAVFPALADSSGYVEAGFAVRFRTRNNSWTACRFERLRIDVSGAPGVLHTGTALERTLDEQIAPMATSTVVVDSFVVQPHADDRFVQFDFTAWDHFGRRGTEQSTVFIPGVKVVSSEPTPDAADFRIAGVYPQPVEREGRVLHVLLAGDLAGDAVLTMRDILGRVAFEHKAWKAAGAQVLTVTPGTVPAGMYLLHVRLSGRERSMMLHVR